MDHKEEGGTFDECLCAKLLTQHNSVALVRLPGANSQNVERGHQVRLLPRQQQQRAFPQQYVEWRTTPRTRRGRPWEFRRTHVADPCPQTHTCRGVCPVHPSRRHLKLSTTLMRRQVASRPHIRALTAAQGPVSGPCPNFMASSLRDKTVL